MDKTKVLILGTGRHSRLLMDLLAGYGNLFNVVMQELPKGPVGKEPDILICDESTSLANLDFSKLKEKMYALHFGGHPKITHLSGESLYDWSVKSPDHPTRNREPKGPRNKWGKLK